MSNGVATLVSIPASNYVEKARWALQFAGVAFREEKWAPLFVYLSTKPKGGRSVPLLVLPSPSGAVLTDSSDILDYCAQKRPDLYPNEDTKRLELYYDTELGPHARRCGAFSRRTFPPLTS
jgi:glutathione S-transferase